MMTKHDAAKILYGEVPGGDLTPLRMMDYAQGECGKAAIRNTWRDDAWHAVWWTLHALSHDEKQGCEVGKAYLELTKRG